MGSLQNYTTFLIIIMSKAIELEFMIKEKNSPRIE